MNTGRRAPILWAIAAALAFMPLSGYAEQDPAAPPSGLTPTHMTLKRLLTLHRVAVGRVPAGTAKTRVEHWQLTEGGLSGTQTLMESGDDYREDTLLGPFSSAHGQLAGKTWTQNRNGLVRYTSGIHRRDDIDALALKHPFEAGSGVSIAGEVTAPLHAYVVKVDPKGGRVEYLFYDASTYLLAREEDAEEDRRVVVTYDDFRTTQGVKTAWHVHQSNGLPDDDTDWKLQSLAFGTTVNAASLAVPQSRDPLVLDGARVTLPAKINGDRIVLTAGLGEHKVNFILDSGSSSILLNRAVGDATGVKSFGKMTEETAGTYSSSDALVPAFGFGVATMRNVAVETAPFEQRTEDGTPIAGLMGYDFIAGAVIHVDYANGTVEAIAPSSFSPPAGAIALHIRLDDGVPIASARIGSATGDGFIVDTGADRSMIFSGFASAHPTDVADQGLGDEAVSAVPLIGSINGVGGTVQVHSVQVASLGLGSLNLPDWRFDVSQNAPSFEGEDYDGLIGQDVLRNFDLYLDYSRSMLYLVPNARYRERWGG